LILACGERFDDAEISEDNALWSIEFVRRAANTFREMVLLYSSDTSWERDKKKVVQMLEHEKNRGMSKRDLTRKTPWMRDKRTRDGYIADLEEAGMIMQAIHPETKLVWLWASPYEYQKKEK
jgi:hypothetical protein